MSNVMHALRSQIATLKKELDFLFKIYDNYINIPATPLLACATWAGLFFFLGS